MCLAVINKEFNPPDPEIRMGWKVFLEVLGGRFRGEFFHMLENGKSYIPGQWYKSWDGPTIPWISKTPTYERGFHVFTSEADARSWQGKHGGFCGIRKIEYRDTVVEGLQRNFDDHMLPCHVAKQMRIIP